MNVTFFEFLTNHFSAYFSKPGTHPIASILEKSVDHRPLPPLSRHHPPPPRRSLPPLTAAAPRPSSLLMAFLPSFPTAFVCSPDGDRASERVRVAFLHPDDHGPRSEGRKDGGRKEREGERESAAAATDARHSVHGGGGAAQGGGGSGAGVEGRIWNDVREDLVYNSSLSLA